MRVGVLGAWSIDNTGDPIIGWATRRALRARLPGAEVIGLAARLPGERWGHDFGPARGIDGELHPVPVDDLSWARELDALVIGGGGLVNFAPAFRVFLLGGARWDGPPAAWSAVCSQNTPPYAASPDDRERVRRCCEQLAYVSVRNGTTLKLLRQCGFAGPVHVVPDAAFAVDDPGGNGSPEPSPGGFPIGLSLGNALADPRAAGFHDALFAALDRLVRGPRGATLHLLPFGNVYGDQRLAELAAARLPSARLERPAGPLETWRTVGRMRLYLGARLHGVIAALLQQVPLLALDEYFSDQVASSKLRELAVEADLEPLYLSPLITRDPAPKLALALALADGVGSPFADVVARARARLDAHWDAMLRALGLPC